MCIRDSAEHRVLPDRLCRGDVPGAFPPPLPLGERTPEVGAVSEPTVRITTHAHFSAAHRLHNDAKDAEWNRRVFDKCNNPHSHGHTYGLDVTVEAVSYTHLRAHETVL